jgi:hypothetical protein
VLPSAHGEGNDCGQFLPLLGFGDCRLGFGIEYVIFAKLFCHFFVKMPNTFKEIQASH